MTRYIAVVGPGDRDEEAERVAFELGAALARRGAVLVCGGLGGAMEAAAKGAKSAGGTTVGILPGDDRRAANAFIDVAVATGLGEARNVLVVRAGDAIIAVGGGYGTLSEIALALKLGKPVVGIETWNLARSDQFDQAVKRAHDPVEAVELALRLLTSP